MYLYFSACPHNINGFILYVSSYCLYATTQDFSTFFNTQYFFIYPLILYRQGLDYLF